MRWWSLGYLLPAAVFAYIVYTSYILIVKAMRKNPPAGTRDIIEYEFDDYCVTTLLRGNRSILFWNHITKVLVSPKVLILIGFEGKFIAVPFDMLDESQMAFIATKIQGLKLLNRRQMNQLSKSRQPVA